MNRKCGPVENSHLHTSAEENRDTAGITSTSDKAWEETVREKAIPGDWFEKSGDIIARKKEMDRKDLKLNGNGDYAENNLIT